MSYGCKEYKTFHFLTENEGVKTLQACVEWAEYHHPLAITKAEAVMIAEPLAYIALAFLTYAIFAKAVKML